MNCIDVGTFFPVSLHLLFWLSALIGGGAFVQVIIRRHLRQKREMRLRSIGMSEIDRMDGQQFERYAALLFQSLGYGVTETPATNDYGADLVLTKGGKKIVVQAKRHRQPVGIGAVQEVVASIGHYSASEAWVITNDYFTKSARNLAETNRVRLIDRSELTTLILSVNPDLLPIPKNILRDIPAKEIICKCGGKMVKRSSSSGSFYGCSHYPACRYTRSL